MPGLTTKIVRIGNSRGIRIPKAVLEQCHLGTDVVLEPGPDRLVVRRVEHARGGWDSAFRTMAERGDDVQPAEEAGASSWWDGDEWEW